MLKVYCLLYLFFVIINVILSVAKYLYLCTALRFFTFVQNDKFAYCIDEGATAMLSLATEG